MDDDEDDYDEDDDEDDYDLSPDELDYALGEDDDDESDDLDDIEDPRITELEDEEEAPKLVDTGKKGKNKRAAEEAESLDDLIAKGDKASKKQQKKLKNNQGEAVGADDKKDAKKVQFAKNLEQGPTGSKATGVKVVQGVTVDDRKIGSGRVVKSGDSVGVRYIGKLQNGKQFDGTFPPKISNLFNNANISQPTRRASLSPSRPAAARSSRAGTLASSAWPLAASVA